MRIRWLVAIHGTRDLLTLVLVTACSENTDNKDLVADSDRGRNTPYKICLPTKNLKENSTPGRKDKKFPLVLISHGSGGDYSNHSRLIDAFVDSGFIVGAKQAVKIVSSPLILATSIMRVHPIHIVTRA